MEENMIYPKSLFSWLKVNFYAEFIGRGQGAIVADYQVDVRVRGFQVKGEEKKYIYEKTFPLLPQTRKNLSNEAYISQVIYLNFDEYENYIRDAESILIANPSSEGVLIFSGNFSVDTDFGQRQEDFNYSIPLPLSDNLFTIDKPASIERTGAITDTVIREVSPNKLVLIIPILLIILMVLLIIYSLYFTAPPDEDQIQELKFKSILRKYGSRIVRVSESVSIDYSRKMIIKDMDSMVKISDQYNIPIFYILDIRGRPKDYCFFIPQEEISYIYYIN